MITLKEVEHLAELSLLGLSKKELRGLQKDLENILRYVEKLQEVPSESIKPIGHITGFDHKGRDDEPKKTLASSDEVFKVVPEKKGRWVEAPLTIHKDL